MVRAMSVSHLAHSFVFFANSKICSCCVRCKFASATAEHHDLEKQDAKTDVDEKEAHDDH